MDGQLYSYTGQEKLVTVTCVLYSLFTLTVLSLCVCCRCDGAAESDALKLPGERCAHSSHPPSQQAGYAGASLPALEVEEKEEREDEAELHRCGVT